MESKIQGLNYPESPSSTPAHSHDGRASPVTAHEPNFCVCSKCYVAIKLVKDNCQIMRKKLFALGS